MSGGGEIDTKTAVEVGASATSKGMKPEQLYQLARASETLARRDGREHGRRPSGNYALQVVNAKKPTEGELRQIMEQASAVQGCPWLVDGTTWRTKWRGDEGPAGRCKARHAGSRHAGRLVLLGLFPDGCSLRL